MLRLHPAVYQTWLQCAKPIDTIPLSKAIRSLDGKEIWEVTVDEGMSVHLSISAYNRCVYLFLEVRYIPYGVWSKYRLDRNEDIFGPEPDKLRLERWLNPEKPISSPFGVYSNL